MPYDVLRQRDNGRLYDKLKENDFFNIGEASRGGMSQLWRRSYTALPFSKYEVS